MPVSIICTGLGKSFRASITVPEDLNLSLNDFLAQYLPEQVGDLIEAGHIHPGYAVLINGRNATQIGDLNAIIRDGAAVLITVHSVGG
ncbi:MAG TPA: hypothetical protein VFF68_05975 [Anaerolineaceae bacterium]|nr:hypothetical protein [Anaerolineaceae bacterium]